MRVMRFLMARAFLLFALLSMPVSAYALGFGAIVLESHLHQGLKATIPMLLNSSDDMKTIRVELATADEYKQLGLQWQAELSHVRISVQGKHSTQPIVQLSTLELIHAPMLSLLLKAKKSGRGTYFKHYQLLLDSVETLALRSQQPSLTAVSPQTRGVDTIASPDEGDWARVWRYGPVQRGDNLSEIAYRLRADKRFSNRQVMLSLYENNKAAFGNGNINRLIKGVWLNVPKAEVVEQFSGQEAMLKLTKLLARQSVGKENSSQVETAKLAKTEAVQDDHVQAKAVAAKVESLPVETTRKASDTSLRYSGRISMQGLGDAKLVSTLKQDVDQQFGSIHQRMMASKLQMAKLDDTVSNIHVSMQVVKQDIQSIKRDIKIIKMRTVGPTDTSFMTWQLVLIVALMLIIAVLLVMILRKKEHSVGVAELPITERRVEHNDEEPDSVMFHRPDEHEHQSEHDRINESKVSPAKRNPVQEKKPQHGESTAIDFMPSLELPAVINEDTSSRSKPNANPAPRAEEMVCLLNQIEERLGQCDFVKAESTLQDVEEQWPDSLRASALKAQLYYETDRQADMHDLINNISATSDEQRWEQFCYFLPSHVWNACFGDAATSASSQRPDKA